MMMFQCLTMPNITDRFFNATNALICFNLHTNTGKYLLKSQLKSAQFFRLSANNVKDSRVLSDAIKAPESRLR